MWIFAELDIYHDLTPRSATMNMAIDEALLEMAKISAIRFYRWRSPALSFGYFGKFADVAAYAAERDLVRRWTGGGIVFHGDDLTYSIIVPASAEFFSESSKSIYSSIHAALRKVLVMSGEPAELARSESRSDDEGRSSRDAEPGLAGARPSTHVRGIASGIPHSCFANPVHADVLVNRRKVAGAAQRRTRTGLLHQGSIQNVDLGNGLAERFAMELSSEAIARRLDGPILDRACEIAAQKYGTDAWLRKR